MIGDADQEAVSSQEARAPDRERQGPGHHRQLQHLPDAPEGLQEVGAAHRHHRREGRHGHRPDRGAVEEDDRRLTVDPLCVPYINVPVLFTRWPQ